MSKYRSMLGDSRVDKSERKSEGRERERERKSEGREREIENDDENISDPMLALYHLKLIER